MNIPIGEKVKVVSNDESVEEDVVLKSFNAIKNIENTELYDAFENSNCSDYVCVTDEFIDAILGFRERIKIDTSFVPNDLLIQKTIPIKDVIFKLSENETYVKSSIRIVFYNDQLYVQLTMIDKLSTAFYFKVEFDSTVGLFVDTRIVYLDSDEAHYAKTFMANSLNEWLDLGDEITLFCDNIIQMWYVFQILLLNPEIKKSDILKSRGKEKVNLRHNKNESKKRKAKYMKILYFNEDFFTSKKEFERKTLCWYVIGHYRKHGDGRTWVNGYWKGPMRHAKKNLDDGRERVI